MAGCGNVGDADRHFVEAGVQQRAHQNACIERDRLARFEDDFRAGVGSRVAQELDQFIALVIGAGDVVPAAHVDPLELAEIRFDRIEHPVPCGLERFKGLFAQIVEMDPLDPFHVLLGQLVEREAEPRTGRGRVVFGDLAGRHLRIDAQADRNVTSTCRDMVEDQRGALHLAGRIEDHVIRQAADFLKLVRLERRGIGGDFTVVEFGRQPRFPQAGGRDAVEIFADDMGGRPHRERLERGEHLDRGAIARGAVADVGQHLTIGAQLCRVHNERRAVDAGKVEMGESARITGFGFHVRSLFSRHCKARWPARCNSYFSTRPGQRCHRSLSIDPSGERTSATGGCRDASAAAK